MKAMRKILLIGAIAIAIAAGMPGNGSGAANFIEEGIESGIRSIFADLRTAFGDARYGRVEFDLWKRGIAINDIMVRSTATPATTFRVGQIRVMGLSLSGGRIRADRVDIANLELAGALPVDFSPVIAQRAPTVTIEGFSIPASFRLKLSGTSTLDMMRIALEQFVEIGATSIVMPTLVASLTPPSTAPAAMGAIEYTYSDLALRDIADGRIGRMTAGRTSITAGGLAKVSGEIESMTASDIDTKPILAMFGSNRAGFDRYQRVYRDVVVGGYTIKLDTAGIIRIDSFTLDELAVKPSKFAIPELLAAVQTLSTANPSTAPEVAAGMVGSLADLYEGMRMGKFALRGFEMEMPDVRFKLGSMQMNGFEDGRLSEFILEGFDGRTPQNEPVSLGRFTLRGLNFTKLLRIAGELGISKREPTPEQIANFATFIEGIEMNDLVAPDNRTGQMVRVDSIGVSWGQFIGPVPSAARWFAKGAVPIAKDESGPMAALAEAGLRSLLINFDFGSGWNEATRSFAVGPLRLDLGNLFAASARITLNNVPRDIFSIDPLHVALAASTLEAGVVEFTFRDLGAVKVATAQFAKGAGLSIEAARAKLVEDIRRETKAQLQSTPELKPLVDAVVNSIEMPGSTFTLRLVPKGRVSLLGLAEAGQQDPAAVFSQFTLEVSSGQ
jgi:hypothetical protein